MTTPGITLRDQDGDRLTVKQHPDGGHVRVRCVDVRHDVETSVALSPEQVYRLREFLKKYERRPL